MRTVADRTVTGNYISIHEFTSDVIIVMQSANQTCIGQNNKEKRPLTNNCLVGNLNNKTVFCKQWMCVYETGGAWLVFLDS